MATFDVYEFLRETQRLIGEPEQAQPPTLQSYGDGAPLPPPTQPEQGQPFDVFRFLEETQALIDGPAPSTEVELFRPGTSGSRELERITAMPLPGALPPTAEPAPWQADIERAFEGMPPLASEFRREPTDAELTVTQLTWREFWGGGEVPPVMALWRNLLYGGLSGPVAIGAKAGIISPDQAEAAQRDIEQTLYANLASGLKVWGQASDRNAQAIARKLSFGNKSVEEVVYRAARQGPEILAALIGQPGLLETAQVVPYEEAETFVGRAGEVIGGAAEFFGGMAGVGKLVPGDPTGLAALAERSLISALVTETQHESPSPKRFAVSAGIYAGLMGASQVFRAGVTRALRGAPVGKVVETALAGGRLQRAFGRTLEAGGKAADYLLVQRADDWIESLFDSLFYAFRGRPEDTSFLAAFLGALPVSLGWNYLSESVGDLPGIGRGSLNGLRRLGAGKAVEQVRQAMSRRLAEGQAVGLTAQEAGALTTARAVVDDPAAFRRAVARKELVDEQTAEPLTSALVKADSPAAEAGPPAGVDYGRLTAARSASRVDVAEALGVEPQNLPPELRTKPQRERWLESQRMLKAEPLSPEEQAGQIPPGAPVLAPETIRPEERAPGPTPPVAPLHKAVQAVLPPGTPPEIIQGIDVRNVREATFSPEHEGEGAQFDRRDKTIVIERGEKDQAGVILHEALHSYARNITDGAFLGEWIGAFYPQSASRDADIAKIRESGSVMSASYFHTQEDFANSLATYLTNPGALRSQVRTVFDRRYRGERQAPVLAPETITPEAVPPPEAEPPRKLPRTKKGAPNAEGHRRSPPRGWAGRIGDHRDARREGGRRGAEEGTHDPGAGRGHDWRGAGPLPPGTRREDAAATRR